VNVVCTHCGLPFSTVRPAPARSGPPAPERANFCCSGCALAFRLAAPAPAGSAPAPLLLGALGAAFFFANQVLALLLARLGVAPALLAAASLAAGGLAWGAWVWLQRLGGAARASDRVVAVVVAGVWVWSVAEARPGLALLGNGLFLAWSLRGLARKKPVPKK
jgi:hypothetical protein